MPRKILSATGAVEAEGLADQRFDSRFILLGGVGLVVDFAIPAQAVSLQGSENLINCAGGHPWRIEVIDAQFPFTSAGACFQVARDGGQERAEVKRPGRGWSKAPHVFGILAQLPNPAVLAPEGAPRRYGSGVKLTLAQLRKRLAVHAL